MTERPYNFSAGPAMMPRPVLEQIKLETGDWQSKGLDVAEMSHRSPEFQGIAAEAEQDLRDLLSVPDSFGVMFLQGGASAQFNAVPLNLTTERSAGADYVVTGEWSKKAVAAGTRVLDGLHIAAATEKGAHTSVPDMSSWDITPDSAYVHVTTNETINGVAFAADPVVDGKIVVTDMSSEILSRPIDFDSYDVMYAGAQKNIGPAGLTVVIANRELLDDRARVELADPLNWRKQEESGSMLNTPPTHAWYAAGLVFKWLKDQGGIEAIEAHNAEKAELLYRTIDESDLYSNPVAPEFRSRMNIPFILEEAGLEAEFLENAKEAGLVNLGGHRSVGGLRASIYNAMPLEGVRQLTDFMAAFEKDSA